MELKSLLSEKRSVILKRWFERILESYPPDTSGFLRNKRNQFTNPVGHTISQGIEGLFNKLLGETDSKPDDTGSSFLEDIIRLRAIQDFTPSQALSFIFHLKKVIREELESDPATNSGFENGISQELLKLDSRIDDLALESFDIFMKYRERIYEIRAKEVENSTFRLLQMANLICDSGSNPAEGQDFKESDNVKLSKKVL